MQSAVTVASMTEDTNDVYVYVIQLSRVVQVSVNELIPRQAVV